MDEKETSAIQFNLGDGVIRNILEIHTAKQILNKLGGLYLRKNLTYKL